jgi:hypothetical protein
MLESFSEWLTGPRAKAFRERVEEDQKEAEHAERIEWANSKSSKEEDFNKILPGLLNSEAKALQHLEAVKRRAAEMIAEAERPYQHATQERQNVCAKHERLIAALDNNLIRTADPRIDLFARELEAMRNSLTVSEQIGPSVSGQTIVTHSNAASCQAAAIKINRIICDELPRLKLQPLGDDELTAALQALRESIPKIKMEKISVS